MASTTAGRCQTKSKPLWTAKAVAAATAPAQGPAATPAGRDRHSSRASPASRSPSRASPTRPSSAATWAYSLWA
jgi:hypothetical protein